jgi:hypothetical protein
MLSEVGRPANPVVDGEVDGKVEWTNGGMHVACSDYF